jgi:predicted transcriptional regulator
MKPARSVKLSEEVYQALSRLASNDQRRTDLVEAALTVYLATPLPRDPGRDRQIIDAHAAELNEEALDVLAFQFAG